MIDGAVTHALNVYPPVAFTVAHQDQDRCSCHSWYRHRSSAPGGYEFNATDRAWARIHRSHRA